MPANESAPAVRVAHSPDVLIVGGGIVGAACAAACAAAGLAVELLEAEFVGAGATACGMGHLVALDDSPAQLALTARSLALWRELAPALPPAVEDEPAGTLWVAADEEEMAGVARRQQFYVEHGVAAEVLDAAALAAAEPNLRPDLVGALFVPGDRVLYPPAAARFFADQAQQQGAVVCEGCAVERLVDGGVETAAGRRAAGAVVLAAGVAASRLLPALPIVPKKGHLAITDRYPGFLHHQIVELGYLESAHQPARESVACNLQPRRTGQVLIGSSRQLVGLDPTLDRALLARMLGRAIDYAPRLAELAVVRSWVGFRPATPDNLPYVGPWPETPGLWVAAGHEGLGITTATATARLLAELLQGERPSLDPAPYAPARVLVASAGSAVPVRAAGGAAAAPTEARR